MGIFYKETLPLKIRSDLAFDESIVCELKFGHKKIFFTVLYRNPFCKAMSPEFNNFLTNFNNLNINHMSRFIRVISMVILSLGTLKATQILEVLNLIRYLLILV